MKLPVIVASLVVASTAYAQAPGDYEATGAPGMTPVAPVVAPPVERPRRWSVGLGIGSLELAPHAAPDSPTHFDIGQLSVRFRPWRRLEIELGLGGGSENVDDEDYYGGTARTVSQAVIALRYRFMPERRWNFWLMAGMGSIAVTSEGATDEERDAASQSTLQFGIGVERRWRRFALQFEVRAVGVAPHKLDEMTTSPPVREPTGTMQPLPPIEDDDGYANDGMKGGQFTLSGNYYF